MRTINVDEAVFAAIWCHWRAGDDGENSILRRILHVAERAAARPRANREGYTDKRTGTVFPRSFEIFRTRKGVKYRATAQDGVWLLDDGRIAPTLNKLSDLVGAKTESAWDGWYYLENDERKLVRAFRDEYLRRATAPKHDDGSENDT